MKKVTNLKNENYFNMCGCSSSFDGNEGFGFEKDSDYDNGYNTPKFSNAVGDAGELEIDTDTEFGVPSNFDNFLNASKKKKKAQKITKEQVANALKNTKGIVDKASLVADALVKGGKKPNDMQIENPIEEKPLDASDLVMGDGLPIPTKNNMLKNVAIAGAIGLIVYYGYKLFYKK